MIDMVRKIEKITFDIIKRRCETFHPARYNLSRVLSMMN